MRLTDPIYRGLYGTAKHSKSVGLLGCPLASAVACALVMSSDRPIVIQRYRVSLDGLTVEIQFSIVEGNS